MIVKYYFLVRRPRFHSNASSSYTSKKLLKLDILKNFYTSIDDEITEYVGVSQFDSSIRRKLYRKFVDAKKYGKKTVTVSYPILKWTDQFKKSYFRKHKIPCNPIYKTVGVSGCYFCPFYHQKEFRRLNQFHPQLFGKLIECERITGKRAIPDFWLKSLIQKNKLTNYMPNPQID